MLPYTAYEQKLLDLIRRQSLTMTMGSLQNQRVVLGGVRGSGGGEGGPIQPFVGKLPQDQITFDTDEFATFTIPSGEQASLLTNLNRIRFGETIIPSGGDWFPVNYTVPSGANLYQHLAAIDSYLGNLGGGDLPLFFYASGDAHVPTYYQARTTHSHNVTYTFDFDNVTDGDTLVSFITTSGVPGLDFLSEGIIHVHIHAQQDAGTKNATLYVEGYKRDISDVETLLGTTHVSVPLTDSYVGYDLHGAINDSDLDPTDRIVAKIKTNVTGVGTDPDVQFQVEGDTLVRLDLPLAGTTSAGHTIQDEGIDLTSRTNLNFVGAGVVATDDEANDATVVTITGGSGTGGGHTIQDEGGDLTQRTNLNFVGPTVVASDDAGNDATLVTISGTDTTAWPDPDKLMIGRTEYGTLAAAVAAAGAGDLIKAGEGVHTVAAVDVPVGVDLKCSGKGVTIFRSTANAEAINFQGSNHCEGFTVENTFDDAGTTYAVKFEGADVECRDVRASTNNPSGSGYGWNPRSTTGRLINCDGYSTGGGDNDAVLAFGGNVDLVIEGGKFEGDDDDIDANGAGNIITLVDPILVSGNLGTTGIIQGSWVDTSGNVLAANTVDMGEASTASKKWGNIYVALAKDVFPDNDIFGLWGRQINFGITPDEHWHRNVDDIVWTGWAAYVGYATPGTISHTNSQKRIRHNGATKAFYYRAASTGADIALRQAVSVLPTAVGVTHAGVMIDDGVDTGDGNGADNYYRVMIESPSITSNWNIRREYRVGGGAPVAAVTAFSLQPGDFYCPFTLGHLNPNWGNWWAGMFYARTNTGGALVQFDNPPFTWTPARVGLYYYISATNAGWGIWDWYDEATS